MSGCLFRPVIGKKNVIPYAYVKPSMVELRMYTILLDMYINR